MWGRIYLVAMEIKNIELSQSVEILNSFDSSTQTTHDNRNNMTNFNSTIA